MEITLTSEMYGRATRWKAKSSTFFVVVSSSGTVETVIRDKCAHMGSPLRATSSGFMCDTHGWSYQPDGRNDVAGNPGLETLQFSQSGDVVEVEVLDTREVLPRLADTLDGTEKLELLAHACFALSAGKNRILFDPWLFGDAYWGSWRHFPKVNLGKSTLDGVTGVVITHPHPDHFHPETLAFLPRTTPIYFPNFPSQIIPKVLRRMGFLELHQTEWEAVVEVGDGVAFAFLRPSSVWEDSSVLVRVKNWVWLNQNDAGAPLRDNLLPDSVDLLSSAFDVGASGYPLTWEMPSRKADAILTNARRQMLESIGLRCRQTEARYFSPFAGWWRHTRAEHQDFAHRLPHTSMGDVRGVVEKGSTRFLETLPGSEIVLRTMTLTVPQSSQTGLSEPWEVSDVDEPRPLMRREDLIRGLERKLADLATMSEAVDCESVDFAVHVAGTDVEIRQAFGPQDRDLVTTVTVEIAPEFASLYVSGDETVNWDNLSIGYWGRWSRDPDVYPARFMRLLQLGYVSALRSHNPVVRKDDNLLDIPVGTIVEKNPDLASALLSRAGLPCVSCAHLKEETLGEALAIHSVSRERRDRLEAEVRALLSASSPTTH